MVFYHMVAALLECFDASGTTMLHKCKRQPVYNVMTFIRLKPIHTLCLCCVPTSLQVYLSILQTFVI